VVTFALPDGFEYLRGERERLEKVSTGFRADKGSGKIYCAACNKIARMR